MKAILFLTLTIVTYTIWYLRRAQGRRRVQEIDEGRRCIACDSTELDRTGDHARCRRCGHTVSLAAMQAAVVHNYEIDNVVKPDDRRL